MGTSKSQEFTSLFQHYFPNQWQVLSQTPSHQIWQRQSDHRSFMAFPLSQSDIDSQEKLQLYNFRKLNHGSLVAVQSILRADTSNLCAPPQSSYLLIENIPVRISNYNGSLSFQDALITLNAAFAGYNTLNFLYGPLYTDEEMIGFTQNGVPKVWVNAVLALNQPSSSALEAQSQCYEGSIEHRTYNCVQRILQVVQKATNGGFPKEFKSESTSIGSFAEGEEFVENYARKTGIIIDDRITQSQRLNVQPLKFKSQNYLLSQRHSSKTQNVAPPTIDFTNQSNFVQQWRSTVGNNTYRVSQPFIHPNPLRSSLNNPRINVIFVKKLEPSIQTQVVKNNQVSIPNAINVSHQNHILPQIQDKKVENVVKKEQKTLPYRQISESIQPEMLSSHNPIEIYHERPQIFAVQSKQEILFHNMFISTQTQNNDYHQQNHQHIEDKFDPSRIEQSQEYKQEQLQIPQNEIQIEQNILQTYHQIQKEQEKQRVNQQILVDNRRVATSQSVEDKFPIQSVLVEDKQDQIYKWEQSLLKLQNKQKESKNSSANHSRSNSANPLPLPPIISLKEPQEASGIHSLANQSELESYIRNKYREYLQQQTQQQKPYIYQQYTPEEKQPYYESKPIKPKSKQYEYQTSKYFERNYQVQMEPIEQETSPQSKQVRQSPIHQSDHRKYTFGKIQLDPVSANHQYIRARQMEQKKRESLQINLEQLNTSTGKSSLEDRYSRYVKNRKARPSSYGRDLSVIIRESQSKIQQQNNHSFVQQPNLMIREVKTRPQTRNLTYDKLRELLWA